jgi:filamentous hemagglutinin
MVSVQLEKYNPGGICPPRGFRARKVVMIEEQCKSTTATGGVAGTKGRPFRKAPYLARQSLALLLSALLVLQPMLANAQSVSASTTAPVANQPGVGAAPNGVPLIDIVTPNSQGLSHNKYDNFNVGTPGLILNNFKGEVGTSNLGGITPGNANLNTSGPASVILNEVTSGNRSALNGAIEVFGGRADVVIANPNGITCDGCGFINTPHATLTTGVPDIGADGALKGFTVNGGDVTIGPNGGNFAAGPGAVDLFDIVSRSVHVNGPVYGKDLRVTAGRNQFDYATGNATPLAATSGTPEYGIDGSALGAMQAGRIKMVVTERGAGVRMRGDMAANAGELSLSADGKISLGNVSGQQGVSIPRSRRKRKPPLRRTRASPSIPSPPMAISCCRAVAGC